MAANLALEGGAKRESCVKLECAGDWKDVDWSLRCFTTVIIDDIFGGRSLDHELLKDWKSVLNDIERFAKDKYLKVIITSRQYITKEAREMLDNITMFDETSDNNIHLVHLESSSLSSDEMKCILKAVLERSGTEKNMEKFGIDLDECVEKTKGLYNRLLGETSGTVFGFPECAVLFASGSLMERHGSQFFESPESHFKTYVEQLYKSRDTEQFYKFLSLVIIWSEKTQTIKQEDLQNPLKVSAHVRQIADCFGVTIDHFFIETLKLSLGAYSKFLLLYISKTGKYTFTHNVIGEMVGVVLGEHRPCECLRLCQRDFLMDRITVSKSDQDRLQVFIPPCLESVLIQKFVQMICRDGCNSTNVQSKSSKVDADILKHEAFKSDAFAKAFVVHIINNKLARQLFKCSVQADKENVYLVEFLLENNLFPLAEQIVLHIEQLLENRKYVSVRAICIAMLSYPSLFGKLFEFNRADVNDVFYLKKRTKIEDRGTTLLIEAARNNVDYAVSFLLKHGAKVNAKTDLTPVHAAASEGNQRIVENLLQHGAEISARTDMNETPLHKAASGGHRTVVEFLLQHGAEINARADWNETPLFKAAGLGDHIIVEILLQHGAEISARKYRNETPLHEASSGGHHTVVEVLLQHGAEISARTYRNKTPLHKAAERGHHAVVEILLHHGADINARTYKNKTPLHKAANKGNREVVEILLQHGADINARTYWNETPLHEAAERGHHRVVEILLQHGAEINARAVGNETPLYNAASKRHHEVLEILLQHEAEVNARTFRNLTPLHEAARRNHYRVEEILLQHRLASNAMTDGNETPLHKAAERGHHTVVKVPLQHEAEINAGIYRNVTPLHLAAWRGHHTVVEILLKHGAEINARTDGNWTPLHEAARRNHYRVVEILLQHRADSNARTDKNLTPLHLAAWQGDHTVVEILLQHGAQSNARTDRNKTPLQIAAWRSHNMVLKFLKEHKQCI